MDERQLIALAEEQYRVIPQEEKNKIEHQSFLKAFNILYEMFQYHLEMIEKKEIKDLKATNHELALESVARQKKLQKAEAIINKWLRVYNTNTTKEVIKESEDFLKEIKSL